MNLLPSLTKRKTHFNNPLSGVVYDNTSFLKSIHYNPQEQQEKNIKNNNNNDYKQKLRDRNKNISNISHMSYIQKHQHYHQHYKKKNKSKEKNHHHHNSFVQNNNHNKKLENNYYQDNLRRLAQTDQMINHNKDIQSKQKDNNFNLKKQHQKQKDKDKIFPNLIILMLDPIEIFQDIDQKYLLTTFERYFLSFFKKSLLGAVTPQFLVIVQEVLRSIIKKGQLNTPIDFKQFPTEIFNFKSKKKFIEKAQDFKQKGLNNWIQAIVKFYCIPSKQYRASILRDVILTLTLQIYEKFNLSKQIDYILLQQDGKIIQDICQIYFSTNKLFLSSFDLKHANYLKYLRIIQNQHSENKKQSFSEGIKRNFRKKIVKGKFEDYQTNNNGSVIEYVVRPQLEKAQLMLLNRKNSKEKIISRTKSMNSKSRSKLSKAHTSRTSHHINASLIKEKLNNHSNKHSLNGTQWKSQFQNKIEQQFRRLQIISQKYDIVFNRSLENQNKLLMKALRKDFIIFKDKNDKQIDRILIALGLNPKNDSIELQDFKDLRNIIQTRGQKQKIMKFVGNYLPFNQYNQLSQESLQDALQFILDYKNNNVSVIIQVIWSWLDKNHLIQKEAIRKTTLQSWYEHNKLVYMLMISMIFGTNQVTPLQMAYQILV